MYKQIYKQMVFDKTNSLWCVVFFFCFSPGCRENSGFKKQLRLESEIVRKSVVNYTPAVDILFIIDNSDSMRPIQELLARNASLFINEFLDVELIDYHIAVTASLPELRCSRREDLHDDVDLVSESKAYEGRLMRCTDMATKYKYPYPNYVDRNTPMGGGCLSEMMKVGIGSLCREEFFNIPALALSGKRLEENSAFYRPEAHLAIFVITDSFDQSDVPPYQSYRFLLDLKKGDETKLHYAAGIVTFPMLRYDCKLEDEPPTNFIEMTDLFNERGYYFNFCQFDYGKDLARFANHLVDSVLSIPLDDLPNVETMEVRYSYKGKSQLIHKGPDGWSYDMDKNSIHLSRNIRLEKTGGNFLVDYEPFYTPEPVGL